MDKFWAAARFVTAVVTYYVSPTPPDFVVTEATTWEFVSAAKGDETPETAKAVDVTPDFVAWLATGSGGEKKRPKFADAKRLVVRYKYRGAGPFAACYSASEAVDFPPLSKLGGAVAAKCVDDCVASAEVVNRDDQELVADVTAEAIAFAGPDGKWHAIPDRNKLFDSLDARLLFKNFDKAAHALEISFANGETLELHY